MVFPGSAGGHSTETGVSVGPSWKILAGMYLVEPRVNISLPLGNITTVPQTDIYTILWEVDQALEMSLIDKTTYTCSDSRVVEAIKS